MSFIDAQIEIMTRRWDNLLDEYSAVCEQYQRTLDNGMRERLKRGKANLKAEIDEVKAELTTLQNKKRIKDLMVDYTDASRQLSYTLSAVDRNRLERQIKAIEEEIAELENG